MAQEEVTGCSRFGTASSGHVSPSWPRGAVFDCDGLLVDSRHCWENAYAAIADAAGHTLDTVSLVGLDGASISDASTLLSAALGADIADAALRDALRRSVLANPPQPLPGAAALTRTLARRIPLAVATNAPRDIVETVLDLTGLAVSFTTIVSAEETPAHKPAPDVYLEACRRLRVHPSDAVAFEDSSRGAQAARRAGILLVGVPSRRGSHLHADLTVGRLDDRRLHLLLGLI